MPEYFIRKNNQGGELIWEVFATVDRIPGGFRSDENSTYVHLLAATHNQPAAALVVSAFKMADAEFEREEAERAAAEAAELASVLMTTHQFRRGDRKFFCDCGKHVSDEVHFLPNKRHWFIPKPTEDHKVILCKCERTQSSPIHLEESDV